METHWILCGIVLVVVALCAWTGYKRGVLRMALTTTSILITMILAGFLSPMIQTILKDTTQVYNVIYNGCLEYVEEHVQVQSSDLVDTSDLPEFVNNALNPVMEGVDQSVTDATAAIAASVAQLILSAISFLITFILVGIIMRLLSSSLHIIDKLPVIHEGNHLLGLLLGLMEGILLMWIFFLIIECSISTEFGRACNLMIQQNPILSYASKNNWLVMLIEQFSKNTVVSGI